MQIEENDKSEVQLLAVTLLAGLRVSTANYGPASLHTASDGEAFHVGSACITEAELVAKELAPLSRSLTHCLHAHTQSFVIINVEYPTAD